MNNTIKHISKSDFLEYINRYKLSDSFFLNLLNINYPIISFLAARYGLKGNYVIFRILSFVYEQTGKKDKDAVSLINKSKRIFNYKYKITVIGIYNYLRSHDIKKGELESLLFDLHVIYCYQCLRPLNNKIYNCGNIYIKVFKLKDDKICIEPNHVFQQSVSRYILSFKKGKAGKNNCKNGAQKNTINGKNIKECREIMKSYTSFLKRFTFPTDLIKGDFFLTQVNEHYDSYMIYKLTYIKYAKQHLKASDFSIAGA